MPKVSRRLLLPAVALLSMTTGGCATLSGTQPQAVSLPTDCDQRPVPYPALVPDLGVRAATYAAALGQANTRIVKGNECNAQLRRIYGQTVSP